MPENFTKDILPLLIGYGVRLLGALFALWLSFKISAWVKRKIVSNLEARKFDVTLSRFFGNLGRYLILIAAILACLGLFGIETTSFAAILGAAGLAIGLAFQGTLSNFAAGVMIMVFRPFSIGDYIKVGDLEGTVHEINLFVSSLDTLDNRRLIVPNSSITSGAIENYTANDLRRVDICVGVDYGANLAEVRKVLDAAAS
ncbi:MAG: mechanosensitive ion channel family protein, partial [Nannocystaceae bacterium]